MINLNYLTMRLLQGEITTEEANNEVNAFIETNKTKQDRVKNVLSWLKTAKKEVLHHCCFCNDYQVFTDSIIMYATKNKISEVKENKDFPKVEGILNEQNLTPKIDFNFRSLYNMALLFKNEGLTNYLTLNFKDRVVMLNIDIIINAYKVSCFEQCELSLTQRGLVYLFSKGEKLIITPIKCDNKVNNIYVLKEGGISYLKSDNLADFVEAPKKAEVKEQKVKVVYKVKGLGQNADTEKATAKQLSYLVSLMGGELPKGDLTKAEASKMITQYKLKGNEA